MEDRMTVVVTRKPFQTVAEGEPIEIPEGSVIMGPAEYTENLPEVEEMESDWESGKAPTIGPKPDDQSAVVRGDYFGRGDSWCIIAHVTVPPGEADELKM